jgi:hypothetical protein
MEIVGAIAFLLMIGWLIPSPLSWFARRSLEKRHKAEVGKFEDEIKLLRTHLHTKMEVDAEGTKQLKDEIEKHKQVNQNLRITNHTLSTKPEQAELRLLHIYDRALKLMERKFPVFVPTWRAVVGHVEKEMKQMDQGATPFEKRAFRAGPLTDASTPGQKLLSAKELNDGQAK